MDAAHPIGIFDSGYGGLTVFKSIAALLPQYDYVYLGDNGRAPYGNRSFETVHQYTLECVEWFFKMGCPLVILACNTASAKALRTIQHAEVPERLPRQSKTSVDRRPSSRCEQSKRLCTCDAWSFNEHPRLWRVWRPSEASKVLIAATDIQQEDQQSTSGTE